MNRWYKFACLRRHIDMIVSLVARNSTSCISLLKQMDQQFINTCIKVYHQQKGMYDQQIHKCSDRIVSVFQHLSVRTACGRLHTVCDGRAFCNISKFFDTYHIPVIASLRKAMTGML